jgi:peptidoglycan/xylan/chitin deacetylase (PgdA/CDA1 family)
MLTIVMYHYVRDLRRSRYPRIKGLDVELFRQQVGYFKRYYTPVTMQQVINSYQGGESLPGNAVLLTFDDGYADHWRYALPILYEQGIQGSFFPPAKAICQRSVLDVNKIHYVLASVEEPLQLVQVLNDLLDQYRQRYSLESKEAYWQKHATIGRYDPPEIIYVKRLLQVALPADVRAAITGELFRRYVTVDESAFAEELYLTLNQLECMQRMGMFIGSHGYDHSWLDSLSPMAQQQEIDRSLLFLRQIGVKTDQWVICYPYGAWNESLLGLLRRRGCVLGLTTEVRLASSKDDPLLLPRLDTNDLPKEAVAQANEWTQKTI